MAWTNSEIQQYVLAQLGFPKRSIELDNQNIKQAIKRAVGFYGSKKPILKKSFIEVLSGQQAYNFTTLGKPFGKGVVTVYPEPIHRTAGTYSEWEYYRLRVPPYVDMGEVVADKMYFKDIAYVTGTDWDWEWIQHQTTLLLTPTPTRSFTLAYDYNASPDKISDVPLGDQGWVVDYTLALCKEMLGRVRNKYQGVPGNELPVSTDGNDLLNEGRDDQQRLREWLWSTRGDWTPPIKG